MTSRPFLMATLRHEKRAAMGSDLPIPGAAGAGGGMIGGVGGDMGFDYGGSGGYGDYDTDDDADMMIGGAGGR